MRNRNSISELLSSVPYRSSQFLLRLLIGTWIDPHLPFLCGLDIRSKSGHGTLHSTKQASFYFGGCHVVLVTARGLHSICFVLGCSPREGGFLCPNYSRAPTSRQKEMIADLPSVVARMGNMTILLYYCTAFANCRISTFYDASTNTSS